jgi:hypothetical protein
MAACLITVGGTSGKVRIKYVISGNNKEVESTFGNNVYIEDTATNVTYTTLSGNATASSGCLTVTELPLKYYIFNWQYLTSIPPSGQLFDAVLLDDEIIPISTCPFPIDRERLAENVNAVEDPRIKITAFKTTVESTKVDYKNIMQVLGSEIPMIRIKSADGTTYLYLLGVETVDSLPEGYIELNTCEATPTTSTTTTTTVSV